MQTKNFTTSLKENKMNVTRNFMSGSSGNLIQSKVITVTPDQARAWLNNRAPNRKVTESDTRIAEYAKIMTRGDWLVADALKFDKDGLLIDGQHRLMALIKANINIKFLLVTGFEPDTIMVLDSGKPRAAHQSLSMMGENCNSQQFAIMKAMFTQVGGEQKKSHNRILTNRQLALDLFRKHSEAIHFASKIYTSSSLACKRAFVRAAVARAYYYLDLEHLTRFVYILDGNPTDTKVDHIPFYLRNNVYLPHRNKHYYAVDKLLYSKTLYALDIFDKKRESFRLVEPKTQPFPLPDFD